jgi:hypothetical protein
MLYYFLPTYNVQKKHFSLFILEPPEPLSSTVFAKGIPMGQDSRISQVDAIGASRTDTPLFM